MSFRPSGSRVVIKPDPLPRKSDGGIWYPDTAVGKDRNYTVRTGTVVDMGPGFVITRGPRCGELYPMPDGSRPDVAPDIRGKKVFYYAGDGIFTEVVIDDVVHHVVRAQNVDAVIEEET